MFETLVEYFDDHRKTINPACRPGWSPSQKSQFNAIMALLKETPVQEWSTVHHLVQDQRYADFVRDWVLAMEEEFDVDLSGDAEVPETRTRRARQTKPLLEVDHRRSSRAHAQNNNVFDSDEEMAYDDEIDMSDSDDRPARIDEDGTVHDDDLHKYPGMKFHHKGNRFYRFGLAPDGKRGSIVIGPNGEKRKWDEIADVEGDIGSKNGSVDGDDHIITYGKDYVNSHPEIKFIRRGGTRFVRKDDFEALESTRKRRKLDSSAAATAATSERRSSRADVGPIKEYAESHVSDELHRSGRAKRHSKPRIDPIEAEPQRRQSTTGQSKQARRTSTQSNSHRAGAASAFEEALVDTAYVQAHMEHETFHHRGQGKWARGLPPPGSSNKTAVRGPDKDKPWQTQGDRIGFDIDANGNRPPGMNTLVLKVDGPDKWPNLEWHYRGGGKWWRQPKEGTQQQATTAPRKHRTAAANAARADGAEAQLQREARAAEKVTSNGTRWKGKGPAAGHLQRPVKMVRKRSQRSAVGDAGSSNSQSKAPTPRPALLSPEEDVLTELDLPDLLKDEWSEDEMDDAASRIMRAKYQPIVGPDPFVRALTKHDPAVRSLDTLKQVAANAQWALEQIQREYLELDQIVAVHPMNGKKERKPVKGGKTTVEPVMFEDKKEAVLYDYNFDPRKIGYQDPDAQRIIRDDEGRELRRRRNRVGADNSLPNGVNYGDGAMTAKRTVKPVSRFDGVVIQPPRKRSRLTTGAETPDESRATTPVADDANDKVQTRGGRFNNNNIPKRIQELRHESVGSARSASEDPGAKSPGSSAGGSVRKGRPPGSKNLHKRKDAGIKKGPRKPKGASAGPNDSAEPESAVPDMTEDSPTPTPAVMLEDLVAGGLAAPMGSHGPLFAGGRM